MHIECSESTHGHPRGAPSMSTGRKVPDTDQKANGETRGVPSRHVRASWIVGALLVFLVGVQVGAPRTSNEDSHEAQRAGWPALQAKIAHAARGDTYIDRRRTSVVRAVEHAAAAVVSVHSDVVSRRGYTRGAGAGVIVHPDGFVVTNSHVVDRGARVTVELFRGAGKYRAQVVADHPSGDLAVLQILGKGPFPYVTCGDSRPPMLGETAIAIGNPRGLGDTITVGVVSALGRDAKMSNGVALRGLVQTDASINTGSSGGALLNLDGELLGIIVSLLPSSSGIAFAIPAPMVRRMLDRSLRGLPTPNPLPYSAAEMAGSTRAKPSPRVGPASRAALPPPVSSDPSTTPLRPDDFGMKVRDNGTLVQVERVYASTVASAAGIRAGDYLLAVDGHPIEGAIDLIIAFSTAIKGRTYQLLVRRGAKEVYTTIMAPIP